MNDPLKAGGAYDMDNWIKLDANQSASNGGSGVSDMILYVPVSAFLGALPTDFVWFYNLNGAHVGADGDLASQAGYEEWRAVRRVAAVPDRGSTLFLLLCGILPFGLLFERRGLTAR